MNKVRLTIENRMLIEQLLRLNYKLKDIASIIDSSPSTISREIRKRRITGKSIFKECEKTNRYPFVCNGCSNKTYCRKKKYYYNYIKAQNNYEYLLKNSRIGIDMSIDEVDYWNDYFKDKIKNKNQPILHLFNNIEKEFPKSIQTFYNYIHKGYFTSINDEMLPRAYSYKPRKRTNEKPVIRFDNIIRTGRKLENMNNYLENHPNANIVEMDTVIGKFDDKKCILTLYFRNSKLMLMFLIDKYKPKSVSTIFKSLRKKEDKFIKNNGLLPEILGIDEFNTTKDTISKMAFIIVDQTKKNIFDINNSRHSNDIDKYFRNYSKKERDKVKFITLDLYKPYYKLMHSLFKNAILIPDRFHIVIQVRNALDKTRIKLCIKSNPNYTKLKKYWKLILKDKRELDKNNKKYQKCFKKEMSQYDIVTYLLNTNEELYETYQIYQSILYSIDARNKNIFLSIINGKNLKISKYMKKALKTFRNMKEYILNAFDYEYSNGIVEGTNNLIKQIKHTACGYRKFKHLKARIMLIKGLLKPIKA